MPAAADLSSRMSPTISTIALAILLAAIMGFAIQRGATCTVAAVYEWVSRRQAYRLAAMLEASIWVAGGLLIARQFNLTVQLPQGVTATWWTLLGGVLLGIGAWINRACVFGAIARLGVGDLVYVLSPLGFLIGCYLYRLVLPVASPSTPVPSLLFEATPTLALMAIAFMLCRIVFALPGLLAHPRSFWSRAWTPHAATGVIGVTFLILFLLMGAWAYTDVLIEIANGMFGNLMVRVMLLIALFAGAIAGGISRNQTTWVRPTPTTITRCLAGSAMMGLGSAMIPGSNDGMILLGMPLLWPYAWLGFAAMALSIWLAMTIEARVGA